MLAQLLLSHESEDTCESEFKVKIQRRHYRKCSSLFSRSSARSALPSFPLLTLSHAVATCCNAAVTSTTPALITCVPQYHQVSPSSSQPLSRESSEQHCDNALWRHRASMWLYYYLITCNFSWNIDENAAHLSSPLHAAKPTCSPVRSQPLLPWLLRITLSELWRRAVACARCDIIACLCDSTPI